MTTNIKVVHDSAGVAEGEVWCYPSHSVPCTATFSGYQIITLFKVIHPPNKQITKQSSCSLCNNCLRLRKYSIEIFLWTMVVCLCWIASNVRKYSIGIVFFWTLFFFFILFFILCGTISSFFCMIWCGTDSIHICVWYDFIIFFCMVGCGTDSIYDICVWYGFTIFDKNGILGITFYFVILFHTILPIFTQMESCVLILFFIH